MKDAEHLTLKNLTARRLAIPATIPAAPALIVPPFGERLLTSTQLEAYSYQNWEAHGLIRIEDDASQASGLPSSRILLFSYVSGYSFLATLVIAGIWAVSSNRFWVYPLIGGGVLTILSAYVAGWHPDAWRQMLRSLAIFFVILLALSIPLIAIGGTIYDEELSAEVSLGFFLLWFFLVMASVLPAALYFFFYRQKVPALRRNFFREIVRLDPNVQTVQDAESAYDPLLREVYGSSMTGTTPGGILPIIFATAVISLLWSWTLLPDLTDIDDIRDILLPRADLVSFAFLGSYVFALNMLFRRYARADLGPKAYTHLTCRIFLAVSATWAIAVGPFSFGREDTSPPAVMLALAFILGIVPETGPAMMRDFAQHFKPIRHALPSLGEDQPLSRLDGVSLYDRAQLLEAGIDNVQSLANHRIIDLMLWTRIPTPRIVDLVDQAVLYLHLHGSGGTTGESQHGATSHRTLSNLGIRTASDLERAYSLAARRSVTEGERFLSLLDEPEDIVKRLRVILDAMEDDEWMDYVRNWRDHKSTAEPVCSVEEFVELSARGVGGANASSRVSSVGASGGGGKEVVTPLRAPVESPRPVDR